MEDLILGEYKILGKHTDCLCSGKVMLVTPNKINGHKHYEAPDQWLWCEGSKWDRETRSWTICGASSLRGEDLQYED